MSGAVAQADAALPWLAPFPATLLHQISTLPHEALLAWLNHESSRRGLTCGSGLPLRFVPQDRLPTGAAYESWIADTGCVPTRDHLHDRYNAMIWLCCPESKARLNHIQATQIALRGSTGVRGAVRDAATLWDENLLVLACRAESERLQVGLAAADWPALFLQHRHCWYRDWQPLVFGHALLEKLQHPYKAISAHCVVISASHSDWSCVDALLAQRADAALTPGALHPLPVMGIPGWHPENVAPSFYQDAAVFRPRRRP